MVFTYAGTLNYEADCLRLVGYVIDHDPWPIVDN